MDLSKWVTASEFRRETGLSVSILDMPTVYTGRVKACGYEYRECWNGRGCRAYWNYEFDEAVVKQSGGGTVYILTKDLAVRCARKSVRFL